MAPIFAIYRNTVLVLFYQAIFILWRLWPANVLWIFAWCCMLPRGFSTKLFLIFPMGKFKIKLNIYTIFLKFPKLITIGNLFKLDVALKVYEEFKQLRPCCWVISKHSLGKIWLKGHVFKLFRTKISNKVQLHYTWWI